MECPPDTDSQECNIDACPVDCAGSYGDWGACSADCAGGTRTRVYSVTQAAENGGSESSCAAADSFVDEGDCNPQACSVDCVGEWSDWGACSATCGDGTRTRVYSVTQPAENGGSESSCEAADTLVDEGSCNLERCPKQCVCEHGAPASGDGCAEDGMQTCESCDDDYTLTADEGAAPQCHELVTVAPQVSPLFHSLTSHTAGVWCTHPVCFIADLIRGTHG